MYVVCPIACTYSLPPLRLGGRGFQQSDNVRGETNLRVFDIACTIVMRICWKQCNLFLLKNMKYSLRYDFFHLFKFKMWLLLFFNINGIFLGGGDVRPTVTVILVWITKGLDI